MSARAFWNVLVIDDAVPAPKLATKRKDDDLLEQVEKGIPLHSSLLTAMLKELDPAEWSEPPVRGVIEELVRDPQYMATAFRYPEDAIAAIGQGLPVPNLVIFDWEYNRALNIEERLAQIAALLKSGFVFLAIYTHAPDEKINQDVSELKKRYSPQFLGVHPKTTSPAMLIADTITAFNRTVAAQVELEVQASSFRAIGRSLRQFSHIPMEAAEQEGTEVADLLADQVAAEFGGEIAEEQAAAQLAEAVTGALVQQEVRDAGPIHDALAKKKIGRIEGEAGRHFEAYKLYLQPATAQVKRGDIFLTKDQELAMVLTPPCDLPKFARKTRGVLTYVRLFNLESDFETLYQHQKRPKEAKFVDPPRSISTGTGLGAEGPLLFPSVPQADESYADLFMIPHRIEHLVVTAKRIAEKPETPLTYADLQEQIGAQRVAQVREPYLSAILWSIAHTLFSPGTRDFQEAERDRLKAVFVDLLEPKKEGE